MNSTPYNDTQRGRCIDLSSDSSSSSQSKRVETRDFGGDSSSSPSEIKSHLQTLGIESKDDDESQQGDEDNGKARRNSAPLKRTKSSASKDVPIELPWVLDESSDELYFAPEYKGTEFPDFRIPRKLYQKLFAHQVEGVRWMTGLHPRSRGGLLGEDMEMGKTFTTLACFGGLMNTGTIRNALVVSPKARNKSKSQRPQLVITSYRVVGKSTDLFLGDPEDAWDYVVLDEGHTIKNQNAKTHISCRRICKPETRRSVFDFVRDSKNVLGLSRHDVFYKTSDAVEKGHDGTKSAFSSVPVDGSSLLDNVVDTEMAEMTMPGLIDNPMSNAHRPTPHDSFSQTSQSKIVDLNMSVDRNVPKKRAFTPKVFSIEKESSFQAPLFQFDDFELDVPQVPAFKPKEIIDVDSDDDFSLTGGPLLSRVPSVIKREQAATKPTISSSSFQPIKLEEKGPSMQCDLLAASTEVKSEGVIDSEDFKSEDCRVATEPGKADESGSTELFSGDEVMNSLDGIRGTTPSPLDSTTGVNENAASVDSLIESKASLSASTSANTPSVGAMLEHAILCNQTGQPRRALHHLSNILDSHYDKLDDKMKVDLYERIESIFQENPDHLD